MQLRHLRYLVGVADAGAFVRAAEQLHVAQPALTRQLRDLENELQVTLFLRGARKATLTAAGETAVRLARDLIHDAERAVERARLAEVGLAGRVVVAAGPLAVLSGFAARVVARIKARYPRIELSVIEASMRVQWEALASRRADIGLGIAPAQAFSMLASEAQYEDTVDVALVAPYHPLATHESVTLDALSKYPLFALDGTGSEPDMVRAQLLDALRLRGGASVHERRVADVDDMLAQVRAGHGWTFLPHLMRWGYRPLVALSIADFKTPFRTSRIWRRSETQPAVHTILNELRRMEREALEMSAAHACPSHDETKRLVPPRLELRHVRSFAAVAKQGSFGRAATMRHISQPALSRQMRDLEHDLGVRLFERRSRGIDLTPSGEMFRRDVVGLLAGVSRFHREVKRAERGTSGRYLMGVVPHAYVDRIVGDVLSSLKANGARIEIEVRVMTTPQLAQALRNADIDVAIAYAYPMAVAQMDGLVRHAVFDDELRCALLPAHHPLANREAVSLVDLKDVPFLVPGRGVLPRLYDAVMQQFSAAGVVPQVDADYEGARTIRSLTAQGLGWALGTAMQINDPPSGTRCVPLRDFYLPWGAEVVLREDETRPAVLLLPGMIIEGARRVGPATATSLPKSA